MFYLILFFIFLFGLIIGSFLNCLIWRLHTGESLGGRSYCPKCKAKIAWYDNIPLLSFIFLRGRCRHCGEKISFQYPLVELATAVLFVLAFVIQFSGIKFSTGMAGLNKYSIYNMQYLLLIRNWFLIAVMIVIFVYDLRWYLILDVITLPACLVVSGFNLALGYSWQNLLFSGIIGAGFFLIQFLISRGHWLGGGDIRLGLLMGLVLGWPYVILAIFLAYVGGSLVGLSLVAASKKKWGAKLPLAVFLTPATIIIMFWGEQILNWYLRLINF
jgi:prepilin signal peptidase PulO-like enzyme (type II secretory pathway)